MADEPDFEDIRAFIAAQLDEDAMAAREAAIFYDDHDAYENGVEWRGHEGESMGGGRHFWLVPHLGVIYDPASGRHIVRHNPAHVLREVAAKRRVLARHSPADEPTRSYGTLVEPQCFACIGCGSERDYGPNIGNINDCPELRDLAAPYAGRPGYKSAWEVGP